MTLSGIIEKVLPIVGGVSKTSGKEWKKQEYVIRLHENEQYPKRVCFSVMGEKIEEFGLAEYQDVDVYVDINANEYNGKWFNTINAWKVVQKNVQQQNPVQQKPANFGKLNNNEVPF